MEMPRKIDSYIFFASSFLLFSAPSVAVDINIPITGTSGSDGVQGTSASGFTGTVNALTYGVGGNWGGVRKPRSLQ